MKKIIVWVFVFFLLVLMGDRLDARFYSPDMSRHMKYGIRIAEQNLVSGSMLLKIKDEIGLSVEQISKIKQMRKLQEEKMAREGEKVKAIEKKISLELMQEKSDRKKLEKLLKEVAGLKTLGKIDFMNYLLDLRELLSEDQLKKTEDIKKKMRLERMKKCRERHKKENRRKRE